MNAVTLFGGNAARLTSAYRDGLASVLRRHRPDWPIVLVSGYSGPILTQQALAAGVSELLTKPLRRARSPPRSLASCIARPRATDHNGIPQSRSP
jgi:CheY-like chemotaxis protein